MKFVRKPAEVEAVQWDGCANTANTFVGDRYGIDWEYRAENSAQLSLPVMGGFVFAEVGDWIVKSNGKVWVVEHDEFSNLYGQRVTLCDACGCVNNPDGTCSRRQCYNNE